MKPYANQHSSEMIATPGGTLLEVCGRKDGAKCSIALVTMDANCAGIKHYHDNLTEIYCFEKGEGTIVINEHPHHVSRGDIFVIEHHNVHFISTDTPMEFACICTPPWTDEHEFEVKERCEGTDIASCPEAHRLQMEPVSIEHLVLEGEMEMEAGMFIYCTKGEGIFTSGEEIHEGDSFELNEGCMIQSNGKMELVCIKNYR